VVIFGTALLVIELVHISACINPVVFTVLNNRFQNSITFRISQYIHFFINCAVGLWVLRPLTGLLYQPRMIGDGDCGEIGGMKIGTGNRSTRRKPAPSATLSTTNPT
jgi:hypothetical protein